MKKNVLFSIALFFALFALSSCEEEGPFIDFTETEILIDTSFVATSIPTAQTKNVFIEEYSGVQCNNCPQGAEVIKKIKQNYPGRIVSTTLHAGFFADPFPSNSQDFKINETTALNDFFGVNVYPSAIFDRFQFESQNAIPVGGFNQWSAFVPARLNIPTPVNINIEIQYLEDANRVIAKVEVIYTQAITEATHMVSIFLTENHIIDTQLMPDNTLNLEYEHEHVVRDMFTNWGGAVLEGEGDGYEQGRTFIKSYPLDINEAWNIENLNVVACVHADGINSKAVYQVQEVSVQ